MERRLAGFHIVFLALAQFLASGQSSLTDAEARKLIDATIPERETRRGGLVVELDREHDGCDVYHVFRDSPNNMASTVGFWSVDVRTGEVWDDLLFVRIDNERLLQLQQLIRERLHVREEEKVSAINTPCYSRPSKHQVGVMFQGEYRNRAGYAYHVVVPPGITAYKTAPPAPAHGFGIDLDSDFDSRIWVDGSYDVADYPPLPPFKKKSILDGLQGRYNLVGRPKVESWPLSSLKASKLQFHYRDPKTGLERVYECVSAKRSGGPGETGIVYDIGLDTTAARYAEDQKIFKMIIESFEIDPF